MTLHTEHRRQNMEHNLRHTEHRTQNMEHNLPHTEHRKRNMEHILRHTEHRTRNMEHNLRHTEHITRNMERKSRRMEHMHCQTAGSFSCLNMRQPDKNETRRGTWWPSAKMSGRSARVSRAGAGVAPGPALNQYQVRRFFRHRAEKARQRRVLPKRYHYQNP